MAASQSRPFRDDCHPLLRHRPKFFPHRRVFGTQCRKFLGWCRVFRQRRPKFLDGCRVFLDHRAKFRAHRRIFWSDGARLFCYRRKFFPPRTNLLIHMGLDATTAAFSAAEKCCTPCALPPQMGKTSSRSDFWNRRKRRDEGTNDFVSWPYLENDH
jgi:hypothetical protein